MIIRKVKKEDTQQVYELYKAVSKAYPGRLTQYEDEIFLKYIESDVIQKSLDLGIMLVVEENEKIIGIFKAYTEPYKLLAHILTNATLMIHPEHTSLLYVRTLIKTFLKTIEDEFPHIYALEGVPHESTDQLIRYYKKIGFVEDSRLPNRIFYPDSNKIESSVVIRWINPNFQKDKLEEYRKYLKNYLSSKYS
jgi:hypothetical protein